MDAKRFLHYSRHDFRYNYFRYFSLHRQPTNSTNYDWDDFGEISGRCYRYTFYVLE
jgi:hypothetical protein